MYISFNSDMETKLCQPYNIQKHKFNHDYREKMSLNVTWIPLGMPPKFIIILYRKFAHTKYKILWSIVKYSAYCVCSCYRVWLPNILAGVFYIHFFLFYSSEGLQLMTWSPKFHILIGSSGEDQTAKRGARTSNVTTLPNLFHMRNGSGACQQVVVSK